MTHLESEITKNAQIELKIRPDIVQLLVGMKVANAMQYDAGGIYRSAKTYHTVMMFGGDQMFTEYRTVDSTLFQSSYDWQGNVDLLVADLGTRASKSVGEFTVYEGLGVLVFSMFSGGQYGELRFQPFINEAGMLAYFRIGELEFYPGVNA